MHRSLIIHPHTEATDEELEDLAAELARHPAVARVEQFDQQRAPGAGAPVTTLGLLDKVEAIYDKAHEARPRRDDSHADRRDLE